jgi:hypothetical protein
MLTRQSNMNQNVFLNYISILIMYVECHWSPVTKLVYTYLKILMIRFAATIKQAVCSVFPHHFVRYFSTKQQLILMLPNWSEIPWPDF